MERMAFAASLQKKPDASTKRNARPVPLEEPALYRYIGQGNQSTVARILTPTADGAERYRIGGAASPFDYPHRGCLICLIGIRMSYGRIGAECSIENPVIIEIPLIPYVSYRRRQCRG